MTRSMSTTCPERQRGFGIIAAIAILVILAGLGAFIVSITTAQNITFAQDIQGARAYQAARGGLEWGLSKWLNNNDCTGAGAPATVDGFTITITTNATVGPPAFCQIDSRATAGGAPGALGYVDRQVRAVVEAN